VLKGCVRQTDGRTDRMQQLLFLKPAYRQVS